MKIADKRCEEIKEIVVTTFEKLDVRCIPISGFELATKLGAVVVSYSSKSESIRRLMMAQSEDGFSIRKNGVWYVFYNDLRGYGRVNNTLMHECGHIVLDHTEESDLAEAEAKFFAKYALAPPALIHKLQLKDAYEVSDRFNISYEAACYALNYYNKWRLFGSTNYTNYELRLLNLFREAV